MTFIASHNHSIQTLDNSIEPALTWIKTLVKRKNTSASLYHYVLSLFSSASRKNSWQLSEAVGKKDPYCFQNLLNRAVWDENEIRDQIKRKSSR